jgi:hypothetical protein
MSFIQSYLSVLNEDTTKKNSSVAVDNTGELEGAEKAKSLSKDSGPESVKEVEKPVKGPHSEQDADALPKAVSSESKNPFDLLYNKILAQEAFGDEAGDSFDFEGKIEDHGDDTGLDLEMGDKEESEEGEEEGEEHSLQSVLDHLKSAVEALEALAAHEESEEESEESEEGEEEGSEDESEEEEAEEIPFANEAVEAEIEGHALVDQEKLEKGLTKASSHTVKGAVPVTKKKAEVVKGKKVDGKPEELHADCESLTGKSKQNVGGVTAGKGLFDQ